MSLPVIRRATVYAVLLILNRCIDESELATCTDQNNKPVQLKHDLSVICGLKDGGQVIPTIPPGCTAIAISRNPDHLAAINLIKGKLPLVLIEDSISNEKWENVLTQPMDDYFDIVKKLGVNVVALDNLYNPDSTFANAHLNELLGLYIEKAKKKYKDMNIGIIIPGNMTQVNLNFDMKLIKDRADFFIIDTTFYRPCEHHNHQSDMEQVAKLSDIKDTVDQLINSEISKCRMIITIKFIVYSVKGKTFSSDEHEDMSYATLCTKKMSVRRKYCFDSVENIYEKAQYCFSENMLGVYAKDLENEDPDGVCQCSIDSDNTYNFPGLRIISQLNNDVNLNLGHFNCIDGEFPKIL